ncbi:PQQ-dependent sugar dehydrogenase [Nocardioides bruguierae]|uniref:PQQ-dependent sugar dehydrogenase n=1 Tax=Nocardioides bruguierae TaxID=2945102 RepID=UPI002022522C|nr:PQQ-dependent sugar dehydrogenase [Nocardioides bruguierae]MCL8026391.1 PQQ-dependent sugar dehydrogenase [Nocardioides bruguierae]
MTPLTPPPAPLDVSPSHRSRPRLRALTAGLLAAAVLGAPAPTAAESAESSESSESPASVESSGSAEETATSASSRQASARGRLVRVSVMASGLDVPWDVRSIGGRTLLLTQRDTATLHTWRRGVVRRVRFPSRQVWVSGETGLMGLEVDPRFQRNRRFYTCQGATRSGGAHDVRVIAWRLSKDATRAGRPEVLLKGIPATSGRHGGCRLTVTSNGALLVGTGDAATSSNPQDTTSLGGKTLRLNRATGRPWPTNPWPDARSKKRRYVLTYGHRNVQGVMQRRNGTLWSIEHGSYRDDEVNLLRKGGNYGWDPGPGYDESVPMTDHSLPGRQRSARWRSGEPTIAPSGGTFVDGREWGPLRGTMAVAALKGSQMLFLRFDSDNRLTRVRAPRALKQHGRLRTVVQLPGGSLVALTSNGDGDDEMLRIRPGA